jgi:hypothetical protein
MTSDPKQQTVERWGFFEAALPGPDTANPFIDVKLSARFQGPGSPVTVRGFYDGEGSYKVRFMPGETGRWTWTTSSNRKELDGKKGTFTCSDPAEENHGPVRVKGFHFSFADGTPFFPMGTTAYAWTYRPEVIRQKTLESFSRYGFNKIRMLFFPKQYGDGHNADISYEPTHLPFEGRPGKLDFTRFVPEYFRNFEQRVLDLLLRGIQADVILFHVYDFGHWGIDTGMNEEATYFYLDYLLSRLSAFRNVWWSLANEFDLESTRPGELRLTMERRQWDTIGRYVQENDPYGHPRSIHNFPFQWVYPDRDWMTHVSYQHPDTYTLLMDLKRRYSKPVIDDEYQYEGNLATDWGNCTPEREIYRHWLTAMAGGYGTHGETYRVEGNIKDILWSYGGELVGGSPPRLKYMKSIIESCPFQEMEPDLLRGNGHELFCLAKDPNIYLFFKTPWFKSQDKLYVGSLAAKEETYEATIYDVWNCLVKERTRVRRGLVQLELPPWAAVKLVRQTKAE